MDSGPGSEETGCLSDSMVGETWQDLLEDKHSGLDRQLKNLGKVLFCTFILTLLILKYPLEIRTYWV